MKSRFLKKKEGRKKDKLAQLKKQFQNKSQLNPSLNTKNKFSDKPKEESKSDKSDSEDEEEKNSTRKKIIKSQSITDVLLSTGDEDVPDWRELSLSDKLQLFDPWNFVMIMSSICIFIGSLWISVGGIKVYRTGEFIIGFGS